MKKLLILSLAALMVVAFTLPASAFESECFRRLLRARGLIHNKIYRRMDGGNNYVDDRDAGGPARGDTRSPK